MGDKTGGRLANQVGSTIEIKGLAHRLIADLVEFLLVTY